MHAHTHAHTHTHTHSPLKDLDAIRFQETMNIVNVELIGVHVDILLCVFSVIPSNTHTYCLCYSEKYAPAQ